MRLTHSVNIRSVLVACGVAAGSLISGAASAATLADLGLSDAQAQALLNRLNAPAASPGIAFGSPVAFGMGWGQVGVGIGGATTDDANNDDLDGSASVSFGLGDARKWVALETTANIISITNNGANSNFGEDGSFNLKLHTSLPGRAAFAVGVQNVGRWGGAEGGSSSVYAAATKFFELSNNPNKPLPLAVNVGIGDNRFENNGGDGASLFGSVAIVPHQQVSVIADWTGRDLNAGVSMVPLRQYPLTLSLGVVNLAERLGAKTEFAGGLGYSFRF